MVTSHHGVMLAMQAGQGSKESRKIIHFNSYSARIISVCCLFPMSIMMGNKIRRISTQRSKNRKKIGKKHKAKLSSLNKCGWVKTATKRFAERRQGKQISGICHYLRAEKINVRLEPCLNLGQDLIKKYLKIKI